MGGAAFIQVQGDITNGANPSDDGHALEYANFKRAMEPFWSQIPVYVGFGDHETSRNVFSPDPVTKKSKSIEVFPYASCSGEASFARAFVNPTNGPASEDGAVFPNGDHLPDAMWYNGDNTSRAVVAGKPLSKGAIERRDEIVGPQLLLRSEVRLR